MLGTTIPIVTQQEFAAHTGALLPNGWAGADAVTSGIMSSLLGAIGSQMAFVITQVQYDLAASRLQTETSPELDLASKDFFGELLPRAPGQTDASFLQLIQSSLFTPMATRMALSQAIANLVGAVPRMIEPWNPADTGARDLLSSYRDVDTVANPLENTSAWLGYNGFVITQLPTFITLGANPLYCRDDGGYRDVNEYQLLLQTSTIAQLYALINRVRAAGITVWVKFALNSSSALFVLNQSQLGLGILG